MKQTLLMQFSDNLEEIVQSAGKSLVHIGGEGIPYRTGIVLDNGAIVSVAESAREGESVQVLIQDGKTIDANVKAFDGATGIVLLEANGLSAGNHWEGEKARVGMLAVTAAFPSPTGIEARLEMVRCAEDDYFQTDGNPFPGFRGGAVLSPEGKLLGIIVSNAPGNRSHMLPFEALLKLVQTLKTHGSTTRRVLGVRTAQVKDGLLVMEVVSGSASEAAGIRVGDILLRLNGKELGDPMSLLEELQRSTGDIELSISRGGQPVIVKVLPVEEKETFHPRWRERG